MPATLDLTGLTFGKLTAISRVASHLATKTVWLCRCVCGNVVLAQTAHLRRGARISCGCNRKLPRRRRHGHFAGNKPSPTYQTWQSMISRCKFPYIHGFHNYGGRGIQVCERWRKFKNFLADMGERPAGTSIDRIDNDGHYEPGNCRWSTATEQALNRRETPRDPTGRFIA